MKKGNNTAPKSPNQMKDLTDNETVAMVGTIAMMDMKINPTNFKDVNMIGWSSFCPPGRNATGEDQM